MKNVHKIRGKREFLFDDRELGFLGGGACVICVLIFILGLLIGQSLEERSMAGTLGSEDYAADEEFASTEMEIDDASVVESSSQENSTNDRKQPELSYFNDKTPPGHVVEVDVPVPTPSTPSLEESKPDKTEPESPPQDVKEETPSQPSATAAVSPRKEVAAAPVLPNVPRSPTDAMQVGRPVRRTEETAILTGTVWSVQVSSSPNRADSERLQQKYMDLGYQAYVMPADLGEKGIWYRAMVGSLVTQEEAEQLKEDILSRASHLANDPFVIKVNE